MAQLSLRTGHHLRFPNPVQAGIADVPQWVSPAIIEWVTVQPNGRIYVKLQISTPDLSCTGNIDGMLDE